MSDEEKYTSPTEESLAYALIAVLMSKITPWEFQRAMEEARVVWSLAMNGKGPQEWTKGEYWAISRAIEPTMMAALSMHLESSTEKCTWADAPPEDKDRVLTFFEAAQETIEHHHLAAVKPNDIENLTWDEYRGAMAQVFSRGKVDTWEEYEEKILRVKFLSDADTDYTPVLRRSLMQIFQGGGGKTKDT